MMFMEGQREGQPGEHGEAGDAEQVSVLAVWCRDPVLRGPDLQGTMWPVGLVQQVS